MKKHQYQSQLPANTQGCRATNNGLYNSYFIQVGFKYDAGRCDKAGRALDDHSVGLNSFYCVDDGFGDTKVSFDDTINRAGSINWDLGQAWPEVNGFNCPDH